MRTNHHPIDLQDHELPSPIPVGGLDIQQVPIVTLEINLVAILSINLVHQASEILRIFLPPRAYVPVVLHVTNLELL
jgi:hypothetical protein